MIEVLVVAEGNDGQDLSDLADNIEFWAGQDPEYWQGCSYARQPLTMVVKESAAEAVKYYKRAEIKPMFAIVGETCEHTYKALRRAGYGGNVYVAQRYMHTAHRWNGSGVEMLLSSRDEDKTRESVYKKLFPKVKACLQSLSVL